MLAPSCGQNCCDVIAGWAERLELSNAVQEEACQHQDEHKEDAFAAVAREKHRGCHAVGHPSITELVGHG